MKKIIDKKTGETFMGELWIAEIKDGKRELKVELKTEDDVDRYDVEDAPEEKKYGGRVPKEGDAFWFIMADGSIHEGAWGGVEYDKERFESGSAFWTKEEAEKELARRKAYVILKEDTKGFKPDWKNRDEKKYYVVYSYDLGIFATGWNLQLDSGEKLYFATREDSDASIKAHEKEWKAWLEVEDE